MRRLLEAGRLAGGHDSDEGFTLIELLVVIIILGILAAIAVPVFLNQRSRADDAQARSDLRNLANFEEIYLNDMNTYGTLQQIKAAEPTVAISNTVTLAVVDYVDVRGYCLSAKSDGSTHTFYYDSQAGGLLPLGQTCTVTVGGTPGGLPEHG